MRRTREHYLLMKHLYMKFFSLIRLEKQRHVQQGVDAGEKRVINFESEEQSSLQAAQCG